jgi:hypothetical protein
MAELEAERPRPPHDAAEVAASDGSPGTPGESEDALIARWLSPDPDGGGPAAWRVTERGPEVWALAGYLEEAAEAPPDRRAPVLRLAAADFHLPGEALGAALAFYRRHRAAIDAVAEANHPPAGGPAPRANGAPA